MSDNLSTANCLPLMEACTLSLYDKNIFRITELPVDATAKDVSRQAQKQQMLAEMGDNTSSVKAPFAPVHSPDEDQVREALARMKMPEDRIVDEFFWFWPEEFGNSKADPAIQAMLSGDSQKAAEIWREAEKEESFTAIHNLAIMFHMAAVDWTIHQLRNVTSGETYEDVKGYWQRSFDRWEKVAEMEEIWDCMKDRVRSMDDEALTTGFIRRMRDELPMALDRVNAEAALAFAEKGVMEWAEYHVRLMNATHQGLDDVEATAELVLEPTRKRIRQYVDSAEQKASGNRAKGIELATQLLEKCRPLMGIYDLFHGKEAHQRADLFDEVADCALDRSFDYHKETGNTAECVEILKAALDFASATSLRERIINNISTAEGIVDSEKFQPTFEDLKSVSESKQNPVQKLSRVKAEVLPSLSFLAPTGGKVSEAYNGLLDSVAITLRVISIDAHNDYKDFDTAGVAIQMALKLAVSEDLKTRLQEDAAQVRKSVKERKSWNRTIVIRSDEFEINEKFVRYNSKIISSEQIDHVSYGIFRKIVNGVESSYYTISLKGGGKSIDVDCKRVFRSQDQAKKDFINIVESLGIIIIPRVVSRLVESIVVKNIPLEIESITLRRDGIECEIGILIWKKKHAYSYEDIETENRHGCLTVSFGKPTEYRCTLDRRLHYNAVLLEDLISAIRER